MITTPEIISDLFSFLDKDQIERIQLVNQFWNTTIIRHKNILPLRQFLILKYDRNQIHLYATVEDRRRSLASYIINFDGTNLSKIEEDVSSRYLQLTVDEVLTNLNDVVFRSIEIYDYVDDFFSKWIKLVTKKTGGRFRLRGRFGKLYSIHIYSLDEIFDNYIIVDELILNYWHDDVSHIRDAYAFVQWPSTPKEIRFAWLKFKENDEVFDFTCNGKLNGANRLTIELQTSDINYGNFIRQWFELYREHQNPISLVGKFEDRITNYSLADSVLDAVKTLLNNTQLHVKYSLETKEFHSSCYDYINQYVKRSCVLHETDSYALVIEMEYGRATDMCSINASDLDQPPCDKMYTISFCVKLL